MDQGVQQARRKNITWRSLLYYLLVAPAAIQMLARLDERFEFSAFVGRLLRTWRDFVHGLWADLIVVLKNWVPFDPTANQMDALSWIALMLGAVATSIAFGPPKAVLQARSIQAAILFWLGFGVVAAIFLHPYVPVVARFFAVAPAEMGFWPFVASVLALAAIFAVACANILDKIHEARAARADAPDLTPLWVDIESLLAPLIVGVVVGVVLALPVMESAAAVDRAAEQSHGLFDLERAIRNIRSAEHWRTLAATIAMIAIFAYSLLFVRRYNWPMMVQQVAVALGIVIADRLIVIGDPLLRVLAARLSG